MIPMKDQWDNPNFVIQWDQTALEGNPTRAEQLDILISLLEDTYREGTTILDLGIGSGLIEALLFTRRPHTDVVGGIPHQLCLIWQSNDLLCLNSTARSFTMIFPR